MSLWNRTHNLDRMTLPELVRAFFTYPPVLTYIALSVVSIALVLRWMGSPLPLIPAVAASILVYPLVWYLLHRFVLHGRYLYKNRLTAAGWKRIHFDHHQDPHNLRVLFGALYTTLPTIAAITLPVGYLIAGPAGAAAAFATGLVTTIFYEFCHCVQHLNFAPKSKFLQRIKRLHLQHHFYNEQGNYGITNYAWDKLLGTYYGAPRERQKSATVFNLGYTEEEALRYPWVAALSHGTRGDGNPRRFRVASSEN
ncbi:sterol desaturase family protein [Hypericibacter sp.]|uniref:sterol desaturase family protein n=1 Tax=Hypericibacter sp. TaxID=2705401 RepID=UPI003D6D0294